MLYGMAISDVYFYFGDDGDSVQDIFKYCEERYGFNGEEWEKAKEDFDSDVLEDLLKRKDIRFFYIT